MLGRSVRTVSGEDGTGETGDTDVEDSGRQGFVLGDDGLDFTYRQRSMIQQDPHEQCDSNSLVPGKNSRSTTRSHLTHRSTALLIWTLASPMTSVTASLATRTCAASGGGDSTKVTVACGEG